MFKKLTPVVVVDRIEPVLPLWQALGFSVTVEVPHGEALGFVILARDAVEVMYQTRESVREDEPRTLEGPVVPGAACLFFEVADLEAVNAALPAGTDVIEPRRTTPYGSTETIIRDVAGNVIVFAQFPQE